MTTLNCSLWMQNQEGQCPCIIAQEVGQLCNPSYTIPSLNFQESQFVPNTTTANKCTCSWSIYNLLSACAYCADTLQLVSWNAWTVSCGGYVSQNSYLSGLNLSQGIPYWAAMNPATQWYNGVFNVTEASELAAAEHPDVTGEPISTPSALALGPPSSSPSSSSKTPVGAIIGGVIGGVVFIVILAVLIFLLRCRRRRDQQPVESQVAFKRIPGQSIRTSTGIMGAREPNSSPLQPAGSLHMITPSMTSLASPISKGLSSHERQAAVSRNNPHVISPSYNSPQSNPAAVSMAALDGRVADVHVTRTHPKPQSVQRSRLNPPPYSPSGSASSDVHRHEHEDSLSKKRER